MKKTIILSLLLVGFVAEAQSQGKVGINTPTPKATLDVVAKTTAGISQEGILIPRVSRNKAAIMSNPVSNTEISTLIYINDITAPASDAALTTSEVKEVGFFYFDGAKWLRMKNDVVATGTTKIKTLEYAINSTNINISTPTASETCIGDLCVRLNETLGAMGEGKIEYRIRNIGNDDLNIVGEKFGGNGGFYEAQHQGLVYRVPADGWQVFETKPNINNSDVVRYTVIFTKTQQVYRLNVAVNPTTGNVNSRVSFYLERMSN